jgi:CRISPR/Cas system CSM-associated protein Csm2 small subunit
MPQHKDRARTEWHPSSTFHRLMACRGPQPLADRVRLDGTTRRDRHARWARSKVAAPQGTAWGRGGSNPCANQAATTVTTITNFRRFYEYFDDHRNENGDEMQAKLETAEEIREAFAVLATESVRQKEVIEAQGGLLKAMDARIRVLTDLIDSLLAKQRPGGIVQ